MTGEKESFISTSFTSILGATILKQHKTANGQTADGKLAENG